MLLWKLFSNFKTNLNGPFESFLGLANEIAVNYRNKNKQFLNVNKQYQNKIKIKSTVEA